MTEVQGATFALDLTFQRGHEGRDRYVTAIELDNPADHVAVLVDAQDRLVVEWGDRRLPCEVPVPWGHRICLFVTLGSATGEHWVVQVHLNSRLAAEMVYPGAFDFDRAGRLFLGSDAQEERGGVFGLVTHAVFHPPLTDDTRKRFIASARESPSEMVMGFSGEQSMSTSRRFSQR